MEKMKLAEVAVIVMGQSPDGTTYNEEGIGMPLLNGPTGFGPSHPRCTSFTTDSKRECEPGDLIFCVRGSTTGRMNWADRRYSLGRGVCAIRGNSDSETKFIKYCLDSRLEHLLKKAGGGTFPNLTKDTIFGFEIPFPESRFRIAAILSAYDRLIENNMQRIALLEEAARRIYEEWFIRFRFPGHESVDIVESELGPMPMGWSVSPLRSVATLLSGFAFKSKTFIPTGKYGLVTIKNVHDGVFVEKFTSQLSDLPTNMPAHCRLKVADILLSLTGNVGRCCLVTTEGGVLNQRVAKVNAVKLADWAYVYLLFRSGLLKERLEAISSGVAQQNLSPVDSQNLPVMLPPEQLRTRFSELVSDMLNLVLALHRKNSNLRTTRDLLLSKLISGELDVSTMPEPVTIAA